MKFNITGTIKTTSPLHIASGERNVRFNPATNRKIYGDQGGVPLTVVQRMSFMVSDTDTGVMRLPIIQANTIRGRIRRCAAKIALGIIAEQGGSVDVQTAARMFSGTSSGKPDGMLPSFELFEDAYTNPFVGLFGGGEIMHRSRLVTHTAVPQLAAMIEEGYIANDVDPMQAKSGQLTSSVIFRRIDDFLHGIDMQDEQITQSIENLNRDAADRIAQAAAKRENKKNGQDGSGASTDSVNAMEFVNPGVRFSFGFDVNGEGYHCGMLLLALQRFVQTSRLGGWVRNGFGQFVTDTMALESQEGQMAIFVDGSGGDTFTAEAQALADSAVQHLRADPNLSQSITNLLKSQAKGKKAA